MKNDGIRNCRLCGKPVAVITWGVYRKAVVDAEAVDVIAGEEGEDFVRFDGSKVHGVEAGVGCGKQTEPAYRLHRKTCGRVL